MAKINRTDAPLGGQNNEKQVDLVQEIRRQKRKQRRRKWIVIAVLLAFATAYFTGIFSALFGVGKSLYESVHIATSAQAGFPVQTGISTLYQVEELADGFVALGAEGCVVYSAGGNRLRSTQLGYLRPAIAVGDNRYLLYNRSGGELRVESRTETLYTKLYNEDILLAQISAQGQVAVATESDRYLASILLYDKNMKEILRYDMTNREGLPLRMAYSPSGKQLAVATISSQEGLLFSQIYGIRASGESVLLASAQNATPIAMEWLSEQTMLVLYDSCAILYDLAAQTEQTYSYQDQTLVDYDLHQGKLALLFSQNNASQGGTVLLDAADGFTPLLEQQVALARSVLLSDENLYLCYEKQIATYCYNDRVHKAENDRTGTWLPPTDTTQSVLALLQAKDCLLFAANEASVFTPADPSET